MRSKWTICLALLVLVGIVVPTAPVQAVFFTKTLGGTGGGSVRDQCPYNSALVGIVAIHSKDFNSIAGECQLLVDNHPVGARTGLQTRGDPNISHRQAHITATGCSDDTVIYGLVVQASNVGLVHALAPWCRNLSTGATHGGNYTSTIFGGESANEDHVDCGAGAYAVGLIVHYGSMVDAVGLICDTWTPSTKPAAPPPPPQNNTPPPPPPSKKGPPLVVNNGDNGDGNNDNGNGGDTAVSAGGTTIYKQPNGDESDDNIAGFVDPGGTVTVISCDAGGFCHVSAPANGYVWHEDIGR